MRNLHLSQVSVKKLNINSKEPFCSCYGHYDDLAKGDLYVCTSNLLVFNFDDTGEVKWTTNLCNLVPIQSKPVNISYLTLTNTLNVGLATGELITLSDFGSNCDIVGVCENGLLAMEWSPDQELLVLVTTSLKVILMSCTFDPLKESNLHNEDFGEKAFITVGWGKKETQFHGSEGKQAAKAKNNENTDECVVLDDKIIISWRGDGNLFAVGYNVEGIRRFKVFDREGNLQTTSEKVQGLEANLSWRPSGNLIATTQKLAQKYVVSFFEKNGLKHGEFTLPINSTTVVEDLIWSTDSEVLIILCKDTEINCEVVYLYTRRNYHWYLKQTLNFRSDQKINNILCDSDFDAANEKKIHVLCQNGECYSYSWNWNVDHSMGKSTNDDAIVAVVDGRKVLITDFRHVVVPPPMSNIELEFDNNINSIHFISEESNTDTNSFIVSFGNKMAIVQQIQKKPLQYSIINTMTTAEYQFPFEHYKWHWLNNDILLCVSVNKDSTYSLNQYKIENNKLIETNNVMLPLPVTNMQSHPTGCPSVFLELNSGEILMYKCDGTISPSEVYFPVPCPEFNVVLIDNELTFIGLSHKGCLYINDQLIINNVNSYFVHTQFLLVTTLKHLLICVELTKSGLDSLASYDKTETSSMVYTRKVERGSKLVIGVPNDTRTVFQMPRGNLETIQPRPLSLKIIAQYLDSLNYYEAFDLMRKQRINLNLIYDHDPNLFVDNIDVFLKSICNNSWLSLFLADLENVDVTKTMYSSSYSERRNGVIEPYSSNSKIHYICDIIRTHIQKSSNSSERILPLLTTFVKKNTVDDLEQALQLVKNLKIQETNGIKPLVSSDEALKYLLYLVNVDNLFDVALGMYDFDLVLLVANKSQKDPKEYIPMLNELNEMDENYKRFSINKHLKRFNKAVDCLAKCGQSQHADLRTFVKYHSLYREALVLFTRDDEIFKQISDDYGSYLKLKKQYIEAGFVYEKAGSEDKAIECYKEALEWELVFKLAKNKSRDILDMLISDIVKALKDEKRYSEAVNILEKYGNNQEETIICAIECSKYKTALRLCSLHNRNDLIDTHLIPHLLEEYNDTKELIEKNRSNFIQYRSRLFVVRENKNKKNLENYDMCANRDMDLYSDAGSTIASSSGSGRSYRSSKNRRKHERKVASLKEGSQYEDTALVMALHSLVTSTFELRPQVREINTALCCCNKDKDAATLQLNLDSLMKEMKDSFKQIWNNELVLEATNATIAAENVPEGTTVIPQGMASLAPHMRIEPLIQDMKWKLENLY